MNARQKAKKLKKELEVLKEDKSIHGNLWLKIDGCNLHAHCKFCNKEITMDSQGNWF